MEDHQYYGSHQAPTKGHGDRPAIGKGVWPTAILGEGLDLPRDCESGSLEAAGTPQIQTRLVVEKGSIL